MNIIDLFSGVGGLTLGATRAGFKVIAALDNNPITLDSHKQNFPTIQHIDCDISKLMSPSLIKNTILKSDEEICGIIGGPPCQGFSSIGTKNQYDARNSLFNQFFVIVKAIQPQFFLAENVPGILHKKYKSIILQALKHVKNYTILPHLIIKASDYGAPTIRKRVFFIGYKKNSFVKIKENFFIPEKKIQSTNVKVALRGLPSYIDSSWQTKESGWRKLEEEYGESAFSQRLFGYIPKGVGNKEAVFRLLQNREVSGCLGTKHSSKVIKRYSSLKFGQTDPISKSKRLDPKGFCPTLRAGTGKEHGSYQAVRPIHPLHNRVITPREAARLQGFPDWFLFHPTKWHSFRQIGNSVSPIVAEYILKKIFYHLK